MKNAFVLGSGEARLQEWGYVALSRARELTRIYVAGVPRERESHFHELDDRDPVTRLAGALEESAIERLAIDQRPVTEGPRRGTRAELQRDASSPAQRSHARLIEQQRLALVKLQVQAQHRLEEAERKLSKVGPFGRRRAEALRVEVSLQRTAVRMAGEKLAALDLAGEKRRPCRVEPPEPRNAPGIKSEPAIRHEVSSLGVEL